VSHAITFSLLEIRRNGPCTWPLLTALDGTAADARERRASRGPPTAAYATTAVPRIMGDRTIGWIVMTGRERLLGETRQIVGERCRKEALGCM
jgi:hypothetical protein